MSHKSLKDDLRLIDEIENIRTKNNVNWMDLLRIGITYVPDETKRIIKKINSDDKRIPELFSKLGE